MLVRPATPDDYPAFAALFPELGVEDTLPSPERFAREMTVLVATTPSGAVVGYTFFQIYVEECLVRHLVVGPTARRMGAGKALMNAVAARARAAGCVRWALNVKPDNVAARRLYEALGLAPAFESRSLRLNWSLVPMERADARIVGPEDDARITEAMALPVGQLADMRSKGRVLVAIDEDGVTAALAIFDPAFPGAYPFRAARPELAFALLASLRPHARPADTVINVFVEGQPAIADGLVAAGAVVKLDVLHMRGTLG